MYGNHRHWPSASSVEVGYRRRISPRETSNRYCAVRASQVVCARFDSDGHTAADRRRTAGGRQSPLPANLNIILNAKNTVTIGAFAEVSGDVASSGLSGSVLFDTSSFQSCCSGNVLATTVTVNTSASVGHVFGNDITVAGFAEQQSLGLDPTELPAIPAVTAAVPGTTSISTNENQAKQLCPGQYGAISLGQNSTLNLNGGIYEVTRLTLADGAQLQPSEPVVILVSGAVTLGVGAEIAPSSQSLNAMTASSIRIEVGGAVTLGDGARIRAHLLATGKLTTGKGSSLTGAAWAKAISIGVQSTVTGEGVFSATAPSVPPPCNDNNACTTDVCVGGGTAAAFCRNTPSAAGSSCEDGNPCDGEERCDGAGKCQPGTPLAAGTSCADGDVCDGDETCDGRGTCEPGTPLVVNDGNSCTTDACDPIAGVSHASVPDGTRCSGAGMCAGGACSVQGTVFSEDFVEFESPSSAQCDHWNDFLDNQLSDSSYNSITMSGTFDTAGITCAVPSAATEICQALHEGRSTSVSCSGHTWNIGQCGGTELNIDSFTCECDFDGFTARPCIGAFEWGGVNTDTCEPPSQNITVVCE